ncbi:hypothetical protein [Escherichia coli]
MHNTHEFGVSMNGDTQIFIGNTKSGEK